MDQSYRHIWSYRTFVLWRVVESGQVYFTTRGHWPMQTKKWMFRESNITVSCHLTVLDPEHVCIQSRYMYSGVWRMCQALYCGSDPSWYSKFPILPGSLFCLCNFVLFYLFQVSARHLFFGKSFEALKYLLYTIFWICTFEWWESLNILIIDTSAALTNVFHYLCRNISFYTCISVIEMKTFYR